MGAERERLAGGADLSGLTAWHEWGPYVAERAWGTVREDYSPDGEAWDWFPHDHARSRAYRWGEDALAGVCDRRQGLCVGLALWNGVDPFLKERPFGLANAEGNHGEDAKDHWWHLDAVPSSAWLSFRYHYPQAEFPYAELVRVNGERGLEDPEFELVDTGVFDDGRYWVVDVDYAKADVDDLCMRIRVRNAGPDTATIHVLPHLWFRNAWRWAGGPPETTPHLEWDEPAGAVRLHHPTRLGEWLVTAAGVDTSGADPSPPTDGDAPTDPGADRRPAAGEVRWLFCENETNNGRIWGADAEALTPYPKDGINDHVVGGAETVNPERTGTKAAAWFGATVAAGDTVELRLRLACVGPPSAVVAPSATAAAPPPAGVGTTGPDPTGTPTSPGTPVPTTGSDPTGPPMSTGTPGPTTGSNPTGTPTTGLDPTGAPSTPTSSDSPTGTSATERPAPGAQPLAEHLATDPELRAVPLSGSSGGFGPSRPRATDRAPSLHQEFEAVMEARRHEADEFYAELTPPGTTDEEARIMRQAFAGLLWSRQFYRYDVPRWLDGDPGEPPPPPGRGDIRNGSWRHLDANDVISMPDTWEYPWFASWDLAFHCVALAHIDPAFAKQQLLLLTREWYQHPNGQIPAYEWDFGDANPPVHAWAAMRVFEIDGSQDLLFLSRMFHKLVINFTWWVNREDTEGNNVFEGGFLGLDNIGPFNRSKPLPDGATLEQSDGTAWMAMYCLNLLEIALALAARDESYEDMAVKFLEHFTLIAAALSGAGLWDEDDGFFYDAIRRADGSTERVKVRSMVGLIPLCALTVIDNHHVRALREFWPRTEWFLVHRQRLLDAMGRFIQPSRQAGGALSGPDPTRAPATVPTGAPHPGRHPAGEVGAVLSGSAASPGQQASPATLMSVITPERLERVLAAVLDEGEFLSPHGLRSLSRWHADHPVSVELGADTSSVTYQPAESTSRLFGGNSNWRGPVWFPLNFLLIESLLRAHRFMGDDYTVELPTGSGRQATLAQVADDLAERLIGVFRRRPEPDADGVARRPAAATGGLARFEADPAWRDLPAFYEYFHGDLGTGLGASHQTGWTALVADLIVSRPIRRLLAGDSTSGP